MTACLELQAAVCCDALLCLPARQRGFPAGQLQALGSPGGLPLLCKLAAEVAAAVPGGRAGGGGQPAGAGGFGELCWSQLASQWDIMLDRWLAWHGAVIERNARQELSDAGACAAAWRATEAMLRLVPLLHGQPEQRGGGQWRTAGEAVAARGGVQRLQGVALMTSPGTFMLSQSLVLCVERLLAVPTAVPGSAEAAFNVLGTMCRFVHWACHVLRPQGSSGAAGGWPGGTRSGASTPFLLPAQMPAIHRLLDLAMELAWRANRSALPQLAAEDRAAADRWAVPAAWPGCAPRLF